MSASQQTSDNHSGMKMYDPVKGLVSIIVPCYNEAGTILLLLEAIYAQDYSRALLEVIIADGMSQDGTRAQIAAFSKTHQDLTLYVIDNTERTIPTGLNQAIRHARGEVVIRLDAHSIPAEDYVSLSVQLLHETEAANVGGVWRIRPGADTWIAHSIAVAAGHPLGAGDARYRIRGQPGEVDTVPFGAFQRKWLDRIGPFNEDLLTNEDYEYNVRIRAAGGRILFAPTIEAIYYARNNYTDLARQYWRYGYWKARMLQAFPRSIRWRQALPPAFFTLSFLLLIAGFFFRSAWLVLGVQWAIYGGITVAAGIGASVRSKKPGLILGFPLAIFTMHLAWGTGFVTRVALLVFGRQDG